MVPPNENAFPTWLTAWMESQHITLWGAADLREISTPTDQSGKRFPRALSFALPMDPEIMASIQKGPNQKYADAYSSVNQRINKLSLALAAEIENKGFRSMPLAASKRTDTINIKGRFAQKTAATLAGLGWVGRHCQLITRPFGSWVRLGTVFHEMVLPCGPAVKKNLCGKCMRCIDACPAKVLKGRTWYPGLPREAILDVRACDQWKKKHYFQYHKGHNCGICSAVCPHGLKVLKRIQAKT